MAAVWLNSVVVFACVCLNPSVGGDGMFKGISSEWLGHINTAQLNYGVAVADVDFDGDFEFIVAGFSGQNFVLKYNKALNRLDNIAVEGSPFEALMDVPGQAIGVTACDVDGDGKEEIYFLNTNQAYAGRSAYGDKLFKWRNGSYVDLYSDPVNAKVDAKNFAGRSVACLDRNGSGKYGIVLATYSTGGTGNFALIEMDETARANDVGNGVIVLQNVAERAGINAATGGRGVVVGPIVNDHGKSDLFFDNEGNPWMGNSGANFLFKNRGDGTFRDIARQSGIMDANENGRGVALADFNRDGLVDIVYGNWDGPHRLFIQSASGEHRMFTNIATRDFERPTLIRTVIATDFDNDGNTDVFFNNIQGRYSPPQPNRLFKVTPRGTWQRPSIDELPIGDAVEVDGYGTGGAIADMDGDGRVELLLAHGESRGQPLDVYKVTEGADNNWIRVRPLSKFGAPARGAIVRLTTASGTLQTAVIDGGSGYLCEMEPVAHFGLGRDFPRRVMVQWPDGRSKVLTGKDVVTGQVLTVAYPDNQ